jgi:hypothetical protein
MHPGIGGHLSRGIGFESVFRLVLINVLKILDKMLKAARIGSHQEALRLAKRGMRSIEEQNNVFRY